MSGKSVFIVGFIVVLVIFISFYAVKDDSNVDVFDDSESQIQVVSDDNLDSGLDSNLSSFSDILDSKDKSGVPPPTIPN